MNEIEYTVLTWIDEDGDIMARCVEIPYCFTHGSDEASAIARIRELIQIALEDRRDDRRPAYRAIGVHADKLAVRTVPVALPIGIITLP